MNHIKLTKVSDKKEGYDTGYYVLGWYTHPPKVGDMFQVWRYNRNGVVANGVFQTSTVTEINGNTVKTKNSTYEITELNG